VLVNDADKPEQFKKRVLEWCSGQKQLVEWRESTLDGVADFVCGLVDITESMSSSMTARFHATCRTYGSLERAN